MANKTLLAQIKQRSDTAANWTAKNPIISDGELIIVTTNAGEKRFKVGDGEKTFTQLPYADENILSKIKTYTAGDGISISDTGVISSTGGGSGSDTFYFEISGNNGNLISSKTFTEIKSAIESNKHIFVRFGNGLFQATAYRMSSSSSARLLLHAGEEWVELNISSNNTITPQTSLIPSFDEATNSLSNSGVVYWNSTGHEWSIKPTYKAGNGISISDDGTISVTAAKIYTGTSNAPSADLGENGDIYIQTEG